MLDSRMLIVILVFALILFGTARLRSMGADVGAALKGFRQATRDNEAPVQASLPLEAHLAPPRNLLNPDSRLAVAAVGQ